MNPRPLGAPLAQALQGLLASAGAPLLSGAVLREPLPSSREVYRFTCTETGAAVVGKFLTDYAPANKGLAQEYDNYLRATALGLTIGSVRIPRLLGRRPDLRLGLLLEAVPGPDLDCLVRFACEGGDLAALHQGLTDLAGLLAFLHSRPQPPAPVSSREALAYLDKLRRQLHGQGLLTPDDEAALAGERTAWEIRLGQFPDQQVLVHGDATPTNFLFPGGYGSYAAVVALDLERLRPADRLWDLSWVAGELKHAWAWRTGRPAAAEDAIGHFFNAYRVALPADAALTRRLCLLNPFYMALAELRIARNAYLPWHHRRWLVAEALRCLFFGRKL